MPKFGASKITLEPEVLRTFEFSEHDMTSRPPSCSVVWLSQSHSIMASVSNSARKSPAAATKPPQLNSMKVGFLDM